MTVHPAFVARTMQSAWAVVTVLVATTLAADGRAENNVFELSEEPAWNMEPWKTEKSYYSARATFHLCVQPDGGIESLDDLQELLVDHPLDDDSTIWDMAQSRGNSLVAPHNKDSMVENLYWPYERAKLSSVGEVCIEGGGADCCCKAVATWKVYARYETSKDAAAFLDSIEGLNSSDLRFCMGLATSGLEKETVVGDGQIQRVQFNPASNDPLSSLDIFYMSIGFFGVFAVALGLTCISATARLMWRKLVFEPLRRWVRLKQIIRIEIKIAERAAKLRGLYVRFLSERDQLNETDGSIDPDGGELDMIDFENPMRSPDAAKAYSRARTSGADSQSVPVQLRGCKQTGSVSSYNELFRSCLVHLQGRSEGENIELYQKGLMRHLRPLVAARKPRTLEEAMELAEVVEIASCLAPSSQDF